MTHRRLLALLLGSVFVLAVAACDEAGEGAPPKKEAGAAPPTVSVRVFNKLGQLIGPVSMPAVRKSKGEWASALSVEAFRVLRHAGTEAPGCGDLLDNKRAGVYSCTGCGLPLFSSGSKFTSGTGWPSFFQPIAKENVAERADGTHGMRRVEILCARCDGHLGHVFNDGPKPTGQRYCLNSASLRFTDETDLKTLADPALEAKAAAPVARKEVIFAGGCFWCVEAVFEQLDGVLDAVSGYAGGSPRAATYDMVSSGMTKHAECVKIVYDANKISYEDLLAIHFATHDPTTLNQQGHDIGTHYRSAIFYQSEAERVAASKWIAKHQKTLGADHKIVTTLEAFKSFHPAEPRHQNFVCDNPMQGYVRNVALPKVEKVRKQFKDKLKPATTEQEGADR